MFEFILARYNYWIVIILMMTGLYIVFSRGNLVKTIVGLNLFQTSVFIFYITVGKVAGGTAPILMGGHGGGHEAGHGEEHGDSHGAEHDEDHGQGHEGAHDDGQHDTADGSVHAEGTADAPLSEEEALAFATGERANALEPNRVGEVAASRAPAESLHDLQVAVPSNALLDPNRRDDAAAAPPVEGDHGGDTNGIEIVVGDASSTSEAAHGAEHGAAHSTDAGHAADAAHVGHDGAADMAHGVAGHADVLYSNPLPHVLILTAIVVGVATTAVGLAIAVRIREAYGTIEEDQLEAMDNQDAFGTPTGESPRP